MSVWDRNNILFKFKRYLKLFSCRIFYTIVGVAARLAQCGIIISVRIFIFNEYPNQCQRNKYIPVNMRRKPNTYVLLSALRPTKCIYLFGGLDRVDSIVPRYGLDGAGIETRWGRVIP